MLMGVDGKEVSTGRREPVEQVRTVVERRAGWRTWYMLGVLLLLSVTSQLDRMIVGLLIPMIKADLHVTDLQISLMQGLAFALFFSILGIPLGYLIDRWPRRLLILAGVLTWSIATFLCGLVHGILYLFIARLAVGAGEATLSPGAYSLMGDTMPRRRLGIAFSVFGMGATIGNGVAFALGGLVLTMVPSSGVSFHGEHFAAWQIVFMVAAVPSLIVAPLILTFREPDRLERLEPTVRPTFNSAIRFVLSRKGFYVPMFLAYAALLMCAIGWVSWAPTFANRRFHIPMSHISFAFALFATVATSISMLLVGHTIDYLSHRRGLTDAHMRVFMGLSLSLGALILIAVHAPSYPVFLTAVALTFMCLGMTAVGAVIPLTAPNEYRGVISSIFLLVSSGLGYGMGPALVAGATDLIFHNEARLGDSLTVSTLITAPIAALLFWLSCAPMRRAVAAAAAWRK
ncbi:MULTISPECIES: MFS transporter [unclassified Caballeronia]|uniref:MFS transporter n=1 Tax=unclassified Caballeronia TaxID=2646786 RepID=UPI0028660998|nr:MULTISPECIES: MFS transporter [unclassified Caballeronia]MDR5777149.1 MFS transporter [Caballeronia sp. LZ002]MDR5852626.1 MFS transporter [Caballeronia sp. LZ003]